MPVYGEPYQQPAVNPATGPMLAICREIAEEFRGWAITWTPGGGFRGQRGDDVRQASSRTALRCQLALAEHRMAR